MKFSVLGGGSKGNSLFVSQGKNSILVDSGFSVKETTRRLEKIGASLESIRAVFVTHEHSDHVNGIGVISRRLKIPIYMTNGTYQALPDRIGKLHRTNIILPGQKVDLFGLVIKSFPTSHDAADSVGYRITGEKGSIGYATDLGVVTNLVKDRLMNCDYLVIEANHDFKMLMTGPYPPELKTRVNGSRGHLSNTSCASFLKEILSPVTKGVILSHLSEENNRPDLAKSVVNDIIEQFMKSKKIKKRIHLEVAQQKIPTDLFSL